MEGICKYSCSIQGSDSWANINFSRRNYGINYVLPHNKYFTFLVTVDGVLDWQLDLLHHNHNSVTVYSIYSAYTSQLTIAATTMLASPAITILGTLATNVRLYSPGADHKENTVSDSSTVACRHYRNRPQRKQLLLLSHVGCPATVVNKHLHCWLLTRSVHVTVLIINHYNTEWVCNSGTSYSVENFVTS
jgi:hypothetical protein